MPAFPHQNVNSTTQGKHRINGCPSPPLRFQGSLQFCLHSSSVCNFCFSFSIFFSSRKRVLSFLRVPVPSSFFSSISSRTSEYSSWLVMPGGMDGLVTPGTKVPAQAFALPRPLTNSGTDSHEHVSDSLGVIHHDSLHGSIQHPDLQGSLFLPVLHGVLLEQGNAVRAYLIILFIAKEKGRLWWLSQKRVL